jgi:hypothetical protein
VLLARADSERERLAAERFDIGQKQLYLTDLNRIDRCVTCHVAIDNPGMADAMQPLIAHSGDIMENHPKEQFGSTVCHGGQGRATAAEDAHVTRRTLAEAYAGKRGDGPILSEMPH